MKRQSELPQIAVIGCGYWGKNLVRNFYALGALAMVCDTDVFSLENAKNLAPDIPRTTDISIPLESSHVDALVIATPAQTHKDLAIQALKHNKHVFIEKPLALTVEEGNVMCKVVEASSKIAMVGHLLEYHPCILKIKEMLTEGILGDLQYIYSNRLNFGKIRTHENALWSFAPHDIAVMLRLVGCMPKEVRCSGGNYITPSLADVTISCLNFDDYVRGHIFVNWLNPFKEQKLVVAGSEKMIVFNDVEPKNKLKLYNQKIIVDKYLPQLKKGSAIDVEYSESEPLKNECMHFLECILENKQPITDIYNGLRVLEVLESCQQSLQHNGESVILTCKNKELQATSAK